MRIGELAEQTGVSRRLLRYYEEQGLLQPIRQPNGYREYGAEDVPKVGHIRRLLAAGLPTAMIAGLLHCIHGDPSDPVLSECPTMIKTLTTEQARVEADLTRLTHTRQTLNTLLQAAAQTPGRAMT